MALFFPSRLTQTPPISSHLKDLPSSSLSLGGTLHLAGFDAGCGLKGHFSRGISERRRRVWDYGESREIICGAAAQ